MKKQHTPPFVAPLAVLFSALLLMSMAYAAQSFEVFYFIYFGLNLYLVFDLFVNKSDFNRFSIFLRNGAMAAVPSLFALITSSSEFYITLAMSSAIWCCFALVGYVISKFCLVIKHYSNLKVAFKHAFQGTLAALLLFAAYSFAWASSGVSGYQAGCLNPYLPLTDPVSIETRAM